MAYINIFVCFVFSHAKALITLGDFPVAKKFLKKAYILDPHNKDVNTLLNKVNFQSFLFCYYQSQQAILVNNLKLKSFANSGHFLGSVQN